MTADKPRILVVDDEPIVIDVVRRFLLRAGLRVVTAANGTAGLAAALDDHCPPDLIVLDVVLPGADGLEICRRLRQDAVTTPIILLSARGDEAERIRGLSLGADDYVVKPFSAGELVARVQAQLRRVQLDRQPPLDDGRLRGGDIVLDPHRRTCEVRGEAIPLTPKEFDLLHQFMRVPGRVFSRNELLGAVWDATYLGDPSTVTVHIRRLREKIEFDPDRPTYVKAVWGAGYKLDLLGP